MVIIITSNVAVLDPQIVFIVHNTDTITHCASEAADIR